MEMSQRNSMICTALGDDCAAGQGICVDIGSCECLNQDFEDIGDLVFHTNCSVNIPLYKALWIILVLFFAIDIFLSIGAVAFMRRKKDSTLRNERLTTACYGFVAMMAVVLGILQLTPTFTELSAKPRFSNRIGIDQTTSIIFACFNFSSYITSLARPMIKSETSVARFVLERTAGGRRKDRAMLITYKRLAIPLALFIFLTSIAPAIEAFHPELEREMTMAYGFFQAAATGTCCVVIASTAVSVSNDFQRALAHPAVANRSSLRIRVQSFTRHAKRTMLIAFVDLLGITVLGLVVGACEDCAARIAWFFIPFFLCCQGAWIMRTLIISLRTSWRYRTEHTSDSLRRTLQPGRHPVQSGTLLKVKKHDVLGAGAIVVDVHDLNQRSASGGDDHIGDPRSSSMLSSPSNNQQHSSSASFLLPLSSNKVKRNSNHHHQSTAKSHQSRTRGKNRLTGFFRNMSAVPEVDYEGTVILTNIDGVVAAPVPSRISVVSAAVIKESSTKASEDAPDLEEEEEQEETKLDV